MPNLERKLLILLAVAAAVCVVSAVAPPVAADGHLPSVVRFGGDAVYPPFEWREDGEPVGFNVDLARTVAAAGAAQAEFRLGNWPEVVRALERGEVDAVAMFQSPERARRFLFTPPFFYVNHAVYGRPDGASISSLTELAGRSVAVEEDSYAHQQLRQEALGVEFVLVRNTLEALQAVAQGRADHAVLAGPTADHLIDLHGLDLSRTGPPLWPRPYAFAVRKDRPQLAAWLSRSLDLALASGRYDAVYGRWEDDLEVSDHGHHRTTHHLLLAVTALGVLTALAFGWSWSLRRTVALRTGRLREALVRREAAEQELRHAADYDADSGLPNAQCFLRLADGVLQRTAHDGLRDKRLAVVQLVELRRVIATFGYGEGQRFVRQFADRLRSLEFDACGRLGRDVFAVLADSVAVEAVCASIDAQLEAGALGYSSHCLVGTASWPDHGETAGELMRRAETALAHALSRGQPRVDYDSSMEPDQLDLRIVRAFRQTGGDGLYAVFQPQLDLRSGRIVGAEALVRWRHPEFGTVSPAKFIPLLEDAGLIGLVTDRMIEEAVRLGTELRAAGLPCTLGVNVAAKDLLSMRICDTVTDALARHGGLPADLKLELTETSIADRPELVREVLAELRRLGVLASVDDFGTGYASMSYLSVFPVQEVKIDRMFVGDMLTNRRNRAIVRSTVAMAHELGLLVVAEGVEDRATIDVLHSDGCDRVQGYAVARPLERAALIDFLRRSRQ